MISVDDAGEFVPFGRSVVTRHPQGVTGCKASDDVMQVGVQGVSLLGVEDGLEGEEEEHWEIWDHPREELYTRESTTVWSIGGKTHKCFTLANKVLQSLRCTFHTNPSRPTILATPVPEEPGGEAFPSICVRDKEVLRVFTEQGQDFNVALQFAVRKCWASKFGLLVERVAQTAAPVLFCLLHPLDDFTRVIVKQGGRLSEWTDQSNSIIYTSTEPSIAVTYNSLTE